MFLIVYNYYNFLKCKFLSFYNDIVKLFQYIYFINFMVKEGHKFIKVSLHFTSQYLSWSTQMIKFDCSFRGQTLHNFFLLVKLNSLSWCTHKTNYYILLINRQWGHYVEISDPCLRFPCNDRMDEVNKLFIIWPFHCGPEPAIN